MPKRSREYGERETLGIVTLDALPGVTGGKRRFARASWAGGPASLWVTDPLGVWGSGAAPPGSVENP